MRPPPPLGPSFFARWTSRIAVFSVVLLATAVFLHRLFSLPTPIAENLTLVAFLGASLSLVMSVAATVGIWRTGRPGTARVVFAVLVSLGLMLWPLIFLPKYEGLPSINDVTTDVNSPPSFVEIAKQRAPGANPVAYPGPSFARKQLAAYPDIKPIEIDRSADEVFELAVEAAKRLKLDVVHQEAPDLGAGRAGLIEIADRTLILGLYDDVAIRVVGTGTARARRRALRFALRLARSGPQRRPGPRDPQRNRHGDGIDGARRPRRSRRRSQGGQRGTATQSTFEELSQAISPRSAR